MQKKFEKEHAHLAKIADRLTSRFLPLVEGERNNVLTCEIVPRLFGALSREAAATVLHCLIEGDQLGGYPPGEAREKFGHAWTALEIEYAGTLSHEERECYHAIADAKLQAAFRICRSLAALRESALSAGCFYLSCGALAERLGLPIRAGQPDCSAAAKVLKQLTLYRILILVDRGEQRKIGSRGKTATYRWNFALPSSSIADAPHAP